MIQTVFTLLGSLTPPAVVTLFARWLVNLPIHATAEQISAFANVVLAVTAIVTAVVALREWRKQRGKEKVEAEERHEKALSTLLREYFKEYREDIMGRSIARLWEFKRVCEKDGQAIVPSYVERYHGNLYLGESESMHETRRRVSSFYQELAIFADNSKEVRAEIYKVWDESTLRIIPHILLPIEFEAMHQITKTEKPKEMPYVLAAMQRLYEGSKSKV